MHRAAPHLVLLAAGAEAAHVARAEAEGRA